MPVKTRAKFCWLQINWYAHNSHCDIVPSYTSCDGFPKSGGIRMNQEIFHFLPNIPQHRATAWPFHKTHFSTMQSHLSKLPCSSILIATKHTNLIILSSRCFQVRCNNRREDFGIHVYITDTAMPPALAYQVFVCLVRPLYPTEQIKGTSIQ